jgi:cell cycle arrest protein BUB3
VQSFNNKQALLDCCFGEGTNAFASGLDCKITMYDLATQEEKQVGSHSEAVPCIRWSPDTRKWSSNKEREID